MMEGSNETVKQIVVILVLIAVLLGIAIIYQKLGLADGEESRSRLGTESPDQELEKRTLTEEERTALDFPDQESTESERQQHFALAESLAVRTGTLNLSGCHPDPLVLQIEIGETLIVQNSDAYEHLLFIDPDRVFAVPGGGEIAVIADFGKGSGLYGYGCDPVPEPVGILLITPKR